MDNDLKLRILAVEYNTSGRFLSFHLHNSYLLDSRDSLKAIFNSLMSNKQFLDFGSKKVIITTALINGSEFSFHHNVLITNETSFMEYYHKVKDIIHENYEDGYPVNIIPNFKVRVWNMDHPENVNIKTNVKTNNIINKQLIRKRNYHTKNNYITPLKEGRIDLTRQLKYISTMDIETIEYNGKQIAIAISTSYDLNKSKLFIIKKELLLIDYEKAVTLLWKEYLDFIISNADYFQNIFAHNLGSFDGYFIYQNLSKILLPSEISTIIDNQNKFILIKVIKNNKTITWKDSYRVFPVSLEDLCKIFNVEGKTSNYNERFNSIDLFDNSDLLKSFKEYSLQDSICLLNALNKAQDIYSNKYDVDISLSLSTSSLSLKIFRKHFLKHNIPILRNWIDNFIRKGYLGGSTDYFLAYIKNAKHYDVNSLYPSAMENPMPYEIIKEYKDMSNIKLEDVFGFFLAEIECPKDIIRPLLPYKYKGETIHPTGNWIDVYFSEELKAVSKYGYNIKLIRGYEFSKFYPFNEYVNEFYENKKNAKSPAEKLIAKMHLNQLYGIFGRKQELIETKNIFNKDLPKYISTRIVKNIIHINDEISTILLLNNINHDIIREINTELSINIENSFTNIVKSNVAIAASVTAYARIHMIKYKLDDSIAYTDTDSIFTTKKLSDLEVGNELGLMKDELKGQWIDEAYFLGIKQYGYYYYDNNNKKEISVFAGVARNTLSFQEIKEIFNGKTIERNLNVRFYKSFSSLDVNIKPAKLSIKMNNKKTLIGNKYIPFHIKNLNHNLDNRSLVTKLINKLLSLLKYFKIK
jgi:hypothetical protein